MDVALPWTSRIIKKRLTFGKIKYHHRISLTHLSIFISVFNQLDAQDLLHNKFYFMPLHVSSTCAK